MPRSAPVVRFLHSFTTAWSGEEHGQKQKTRRAAQPPLVRRAGPALVRPPLAHAADGLFAHEDYEGKPVIAIINTWSDINPCHSHFRQRAEEVKRGVWQAGGFPLEMPAIALAEPFQKPTTMLYRNFLAMETEELLRSYPVDGCVLMGGCDKTTPALLMGAISMNLPAIFMPAGPMLRGNWRGKTLGSRLATRGNTGPSCAPATSPSATGARSRTASRARPATCMTMGTASTMTSVAEALGFTLPGAASIPAVDSQPRRMADDTGRRIVDMVWEDLKPRDILTAEVVRQRDPRAHGAGRLDQCPRST